MSHELVGLVRRLANELEMWAKAPHVVHPFVTYDETCGRCRVDSLLNVARGVRATAETERGNK